MHWLPTEKNIISTSSKKKQIPPALCGHVFFSVFWGHQKARFTALRLSLGAELQQFKGSPATDQPKRLSQQGDSIPIPLARHEDVKVKTVFFG